MHLSVAKWGAWHISVGGFCCRIEPLVCEDYTNKRPVVIPYHRGGKRIHVGVQVGYMSSNQTHKGACLFLT